MMGLFPKKSTRDEKNIKLPLRCTMETSIAEVCYSDNLIAKNQILLPSLRKSRNYILTKNMENYHMPVLNPAKHYMEHTLVQMG